MKCQITNLTSYTSKAVNGVGFYFWIEAHAILEHIANDEVNLSEKLDCENFNSSRIIAPFRTVLFPNSVEIMNKMLDIEKAANDAIGAGKRPKYPTINLNRFEVKSPMPYFRKYTKDSPEQGINAGDWILAQDGDEVHPDDKNEHKRKLFTTILVTCICKKDEKGNDIPAESLDRKVIRAWESGLQENEKGFSMFNIVTDVLDKENVETARSTTSGIISNNPYRLLGLYSNSSIKDRVANINRLKAYLKVGKSVDFPTDLLAFMFAPIRTIESIEHANASVNLPQDQLRAALFWFSNCSPIDDIALGYLQKGDAEKAKTLFGKKETFSSLMNQGVLALIQDDEITAIQCITKLIHNEDYKNAFVESVCGSTFQISEDNLAQLFINELMVKIPIQRLLQLFLDYGISERDDFYLRNKAISSPLETISSEIAQAKGFESSDSEAQYKAGLALVENTKESLVLVRELLGETDVQYQQAADNLAGQILQCGIYYYNNAAEEGEEEIDRALYLQDYALTIAVGKLMKDRCQENVNILREKRIELPPRQVKEHDRSIRNKLLKYQKSPKLIDQAIDLIKECVPYLMSIKEELSSTNPYYLKMSTLIVNAALYNVIEEFNGVNNSGNMKYMPYLSGFRKEDFINKIKAVFENAWTAILYMDRLDMERDFRRNRYSPNRKALEKQLCDLGMFTGQTIQLDMRSETQIFKDCRDISLYLNYINIFPKGKYVGRAKEQIEVCELNACKTTQDCSSFKRKYPDSKLSVDQKWEECEFKTCKTVAHYQDYLQSYPNGVYVNEAKKVIDDEKMWQKCMHLGVKDEYKKYLSQYPNGRHKAEAEQKVSACYIATMVYGDYEHPQVIVLRNFRDEVLRKSYVGRAFITYYYRHSPAWVEGLKDNGFVNKMIRIILDNFIIVYKYEKK